MELIFASHNENKVKEVRKILGKEFKIRSLNEIGFYDEIPENQPTIEGNAKFKSQYIFEKYNLNVFADDTGLEIKALNNEPGVRSARYAGDENNSEYHQANLTKYPKKKKLIDEIIQQSFVYHRNFEDKLKVKDFQRLDLGITKNKKKGNQNKSIVSELQKLNDLFKSGAITKKEFEAAKQKLLK